MPKHLSESESLKAAWEAAWHYVTEGYAGTGKRWSDEALERDQANSDQAFAEWLEERFPESRHYQRKDAAS